MIDWFYKWGFIPLIIVLGIYAFAIFETHIVSYREFDITARVIAQDTDTNKVLLDNGQTIKLDHSNNYSLGIGKKYTFHVIQGIMQSGDLGYIGVKSFEFEDK